MIISVCNQKFASFKRQQLVEIFQHWIYYLCTIEHECYGNDVLLILFTRSLDDFAVDILDKQCFPLFELQVHKLIYPQIMYQYRRRRRHSFVEIFNLSQMGQVMQREYLVLYTFGQFCRNSRSLRTGIIRTTKIIARSASPSHSLLQYRMNRTELRRNTPFDFPKNLGNSRLAFSNLINILQMYLKKRS
jgi:hypothetical protein